MEEVNKDKEPIKKQPTLGRIVIEMKIKNILNYLASCFKRKEEQQHK
jgi:hypothetical protein